MEYYCCRISHGTASFRDSLSDSTVSAHGCGLVCAWVWSGVCMGVVWSGWVIRPESSTQCNNIYLCP